MRSIITLTMALALTLAFTGRSAAAVPDLIPVQGVLADLEGNPVDGDANLVFSIYAAEFDGTALWSETYIDEFVDEGFFTVYLGSQEPLAFEDLLDVDELWLGVAIGTDSEMERVRLGAVPFALEARHCRMIGNYEAGDLQPRLNIGGDATSGACPGGEVISAIDTENGTITCVPVLVGDHDHDDDYMPMITCSAGNVLKWSGTAWTCQNDDNTTYSAGTGLTLSGTTFAADFGTTATTVAAGNHDHDAAYIGRDGDTITTNNQYDYEFGGSTSQQYAVQMTNTNNSRSGVLRVNQERTGASGGTAIDARYNTIQQHGSAIRARAREDLTATSSSWSAIDAEAESGNNNRTGGTLSAVHGVFYASDAGGVDTAFVGVRGMAGHVDTSLASQRFYGGRFEGWGGPGAATLIGVHGFVDNTYPTGTGDKYGVYASARGNSSGATYGLWATAENGGTGEVWAGWFEGDVNVAGNVEIAGDYTYTDARTGTLSLSATAFTSESYTQISGDGYVRGTNRFYHNVNLPDGVTVAQNGLNCHFLNMSGASRTVEFSLKGRLGNSNSAYTEISRPPTSYASSMLMRRISTSEGDSFTVNSSRQYFVEFRMSSAVHADYRFYGCRITYTYDQLNH